MKEIEASKVYIRTDEKSRILACEGGYTISNIKNIDEWIFIDEGEGDKYNLCQTHYFEDGLFTEDGICRYKYIDGKCALRGASEIEADRKNNPQPAPVDEGVTWEEMAKAISEGVNEI